MMPVKNISKVKMLNIKRCSTELASDGSRIIQWGKLSAKDASIGGAEEAKRVGVTERDDHLTKIHWGRVWEGLCTL